MFQKLKIPLSKNTLHQATITQNF